MKGNTMKPRALGSVLVGCGRQQVTASQASGPPPLETQSLEQLSKGTGNCYLHNPGGSCETEGVSAKTESHHS